MEQAFLVHNICVKDVYTKDGNWYFVDFDNSTKQILSFNGDIKSNFAFYPETGECHSIHTDSRYISDLGIYDTDFNFLMGLSAILICSCFLVGLLIAGANRW